MKTKQTKIDRSAAKWLPGAMALAATTASSQAATVQITLTGNKLSSTGGNQLNADLTGDTVADLLVAVSSSVPSMRVNVILSFVPWYGVMAGVNSGRTFFYADAGFLGTGGVGNSQMFGTGVQTTSYLNPITFTDANINDGAPTGGWLQVNAFNTSSTDHTVEFSRLIFDDASTTRPSFATIPGEQTEFSAVPEPSSLGLLALGASGLLLRRSRAKAAA